jgi:hypothetical protein
MESKLPLQSILLQSGANNEIGGEAGRAAIPGLTHFCIVLQMARYAHQKKDEPGVEGKPRARQGGKSKLTIVRLEIGPLHPISPQMEELRNWPGKR